MIKLKNLWKIALATMAMSAMLVACDTTSGGGSTEKEKVKTTQKSETGIYSYTVDIEKISNAWGGSKESPVFSILLLTDANVKAAVKKGDFKASPITNPEYQLAAFDNAKIQSTKEAGDYAVFGLKAIVDPSDKTKDMYVYYDGVAATIKDNTVIVTVNMNKLIKTQLKALWAKDGECVVGDADSNADIKEADVNLADYKPYVLALDGRYKDDEGNFVEVESENKVMTVWNTDLMVMKPITTSFPANLIKNAPPAPTCNDLNSVAGTMNNWTHAALINNAVNFTATEKDGKTNVEFAFTSGNWDFKACGVEIKNLDEEYELKEGNDATNITFAAGVLTTESEYTATLRVAGNHEAYVKVTAAK